jgi:hypothetical protein
VPGNGTVQRVLCTADVEDAHLSEVSAVYDGATPGASVLKAVQEAEAGRMKPEIAEMIRFRFRQFDLSVLTTASRRFFPGHTPTDEEDRQTMRTQADETTAGGVAVDGTGAESGQGDGDGAREGGGAATAEALSITSETVTAHAPILRALLTEAGIPEAEGDRQLDVMARVRQLVDAAKDGVAYRRDLIVEALREGVRANGAGFNQDAYRRTLEASDLETVKLMRDDWARQARERNPGHRQTVDSAARVGETRGGDGQTGQPPQRGVPRSAFKTRTQ